MSEIHSLVGTKKVKLQTPRYSGCGAHRLAEAGVITLCNISQHWVM